MMLFYIKKILLFLIPVYIYWICVIVIDPFDFINISHIIPDNVKRSAINRDEEASPRGNIFWKYLKFRRNPTPYVIFGDSQGRKIKMDQVEQYTGHKYFNFCVPGASYETIFNNFWYAAKRVDLKKVYLQIGFMNYSNNRSYSLNYLAERYFKHPYLYFTSQEIFNDSYHNLMFEITNDTSYVINPYNNLSYHQLDSLSQNYLNMFFNDYSYPVEFEAEFEKIDSYCKENGISLNFLILPTYIAVHDYIKELNLTDERSRFINDLAKYGKVYDLDLNNPGSMIRKNFIDYFHPRQEFLDKCVNEVWKERQTISSANPE